MLEAEHIEENWTHGHDSHPVCRLEGHHFAGAVTLPHQQNTNKIHNKGSKEDQDTGNAKISNELKLLNFLDQHKRNLNNTHQQHNKNLRSVEIVLQLGMISVQQQLDRIFQNQNLNDDDVIGENNQAAQKLEYFGVGDMV